ncbi:hypothetical protein ACFO3O_08250 [Dokdonia ponticola]|uniref:Uncharacterized protein n=1 Tax=Dokdonia ponticola TaxID=2041041 RepID=A0ABV9HWH1_9FLAO
MDRSMIDQVGLFPVILHRITGNLLFTLSRKHTHSSFLNRHSSGF